MNPVIYGPIRWYGVLTALGFLLGIWIAARLAKKSGLSSDVIVNLGFIAMVAGILGARIFYVIANWGEFASNPLEIIRVDHGGLVFYGGFIGAALAMIGYGYWKKLPKGAYADTLAVGVPLGHALGRIGCFLNGCCWGRTCALPWGVTFPVDSEVFRHQLSQAPMLMKPLPVHPTQLYEAAGLLFLCALMWWWFNKGTFKHRLMWMYVVLYGTLRFGVEIVRDDEPHWIFSRFTNAQGVAMVMIIVGAIALYLTQPKEKTVAAPSRSDSEN